MNYLYLLKSDLFLDKIKTTVQVVQLLIKLTQINFI